MVDFADTQKTDKQAEQNFFNSYISVRDNGIVSFTRIFFSV